jgi:hypothetical protein
VSYPVTSSVGSFLYYGTTTPAISFIDVSDYNNHSFQMFISSSGTVTNNFTVSSSIDGLNWIGEFSLSGTSMTSSVFYPTNTNGRRRYFMATYSGSGNTTASLYLLSGQGAGGTGQSSTSISSSYALSASYASTMSYSYVTQSVVSSSYASSSFVSISASWASASISSSYSLTSSWSPNQGATTLSTASTYQITSSWAVSASWAPGGSSSTSASWASSSLSSSYLSGSMIGGNLYLFNVTTGLRYLIQVSGSVGDESILYAQG